jgi:hypothetical protein
LYFLRAIRLPLLGFYRTAHKHKIPCRPTLGEMAKAGHRQRLQSLDRPLQPRLEPHLAGIIARSKGRPSFNLRMASRAVRPAWSSRPAPSSGAAPLHPEHRLRSPFGIFVLVISYTPFVSLMKPQNRVQENRGAGKLPVLLPEGQSRLIPIKRD